MHCSAFKSGKRGKPAKTAVCIVCGVVWTDHGRATTHSQEPDTANPEPGQTVQPATTVRTSPLRTEEFIPAVYRNKLGDEPPWNDKSALETYFLDMIAREVTHEQAQAAAAARSDSLDPLADEPWAEPAFEQARKTGREIDWEREVEARRKRYSKIYIDRRTKIANILGVSVPPYPVGQYQYI